MFRASLFSGLVVAGPSGKSAVLPAEGDFVGTGRMNQFLEWLAGFMLSTMKQVDPGPEDPLDPVDPLEPEKAMVDALNIALSAGDPARLLAFLTSPMVCLSTQCATIHAGPVMLSPHVHAC